eukprot:gene5862-6302_t
MLAQSRDSRKLTATALHLTSKQILTVGGSCQLRHLRMAANYKSADIPYIPTLRSFSLWNAPNFSDCHNLRHLFFVELVLCDQITSLEGMKVAVLKVSRCSLQSLEGLRGDKYHRSITIKQCSDIKDFSPLSNVERVTIGDCLGFTDCSQIKGVKDLTIILWLTSLSAVKDVSELHIRSLETNNLLYDLGGAKNQKLSLYSVDFVDDLPFLQDYVKHESYEIDEEFDMRIPLIVFLRKTNY